MIKSSLKGAVAVAVLAGASAERMPTRQRTWVKYLPACQRRSPARCWETNRALAISLTLLSSNPM